MAINSFECSSHSIRPRNSAHAYIAPNHIKPRALHFPATDPTDDEFIVYGDAKLIVDS